jgi:hypothetical protein
MANDPKQAALERYPFLKAALEDIQLASTLAARRIGSPRNVVCLLYDALEFILYEALLAVDYDIYKNGQNTIGLDGAISACNEVKIDLPLIGSIRAIQKHRGDAKHHAQTPHGTAFEKMLAEFRVIASRLVYERFGKSLDNDLRDFDLLPYPVALYESYRKYRTHQWDQAARFAIAALLHNTLWMLITLRYSFAATNCHY